jgi:hypothetical protein
MLDEVH